MPAEGSQPSEVSTLLQSGEQLAKISVALAGLSTEALKANVKPLAEQDWSAASDTDSYAQAALLLRGLLHGSKQANHRKGAGLVQPILSSPQRGAALTLQLQTAAKATTTGSPAAPAEPAGQQTQQQNGHAHPSGPGQAPPSSLAAAVCCAIGVASLASERTQLLFSSLEQHEQVHEGQLQQYQRSLEALSSKATALSLAAAAASMGLPAQAGSSADVDAAALLGSCLQALQGLLALEAWAAVLSLQQQEGTPAGPKPAADGAAPDQPKKSSKGPQVKLGRGTALLRDALQRCIPPPGEDGGDSASMHTQSLQDGICVLAARSMLKTVFALAAESRPAATSAFAVLLRDLPFPQAMGQELDPSGSRMGVLLQELEAAAEEALSSGGDRKAKAPKGTRDIMPEDSAVREVVFAAIIRVFQRHGAVSIDTPVFELKKTLTGKYGEDSKLIYDLADQGGEALSLRYDLTVPFARFMASHALPQLKRYHIAKVYRRDQPQLARGRYREFTQCDFDIAGKGVPMAAEAEVLQVVHEIMQDLKVGEYTIKLNHRLLLDAMMRVCGVPASSFRAICSSIDKLDKEPWEAVEQEMTQQKGLPLPVAQKIKGYVQLAGSLQSLLQQLVRDHAELQADQGAAQACKDLQALLDLLQSCQVLGNISFDLSLARGLDYYTGLIYEVVLKESTVGSIAAGGRYDGLVGMFSGKDIAAVGVSIGIERLFTVMSARMGAAMRATHTQVLVASAGKGLFPKRWALANELWQVNVAAEFGLNKPDPSPVEQFGYANASGIPLVVIFGEAELTSGVVKLKDMASGNEEEIKRDELASFVAQRLKRLAQQQLNISEQ